MKNIFHFYSIGISFILATLPLSVDAQPMSLSKKGYVGEWACESKSHVIYAVSPLKTLPCATPPETLVIRSEHPNELIIESTNTSFGIPSSVTVTQKNVQNTNTENESIMVPGLLMPRYISLADKNTLFYIDHQGGNSTLTITFKRREP